MLFRRLIIVLILMSGLQSSVTAGEAPRFFPEVAEWSAAGATFYMARRLDHQPARNSRKFFNQVIDKAFQENTVSNSQLYAAAGVTALGIGLIPNSDGWLRESAYCHTKGLVETLSATYLLTVLTKNIVGRQRPCFSNYPEDERLDANKSFPSGHTSIAFALAGYSSRYVLDHFGGGAQTFQWLYVAGSHGLAAYVGYTRIADNRHFLADVIAGGLLGNGVAWLIYEYQERNLSDNETENNVSKSVVPYFITFSIPL